MEQVDLAVIIGRFQPPHLSHQKMLKEALRRARHVLVLTGSANAARSVKNPFSFEERSLMIRLAAGTEAMGKQRVTVRPIRDTHYNDSLWIAQVQEKVAQAMYETAPNVLEPDVIMVGNFSDQSSYYLQYFPQWQKVPVVGVSEVHSTEVRNKLYSDNPDHGQEAMLHLPEEIHPFIREFRKSDLCHNLMLELKYIEDYKDAWSETPFPVIFVTVDAVVTCQGHVLVVRRKTEPGKGLYAMPGGFLKQGEFIVDGMLRELKEETGIRIDKPVLRKNIVSSRVADYPGRSLRGRTITHAHHIRLEGGTLPEVKGGDDADKAFWMPFADVYKEEDKFFEDHSSIIQSFITQG